MAVHPLVAVLVLSTGVQLIGCGTPRVDPEQGPRRREVPTDASLDQGYAILLDLLADESKLDGVLAIKSPRPALASLIREVAETARDDRAWLEARLAGHHPVDPRSTGLPRLESEARRRIARAETPSLILSGGRTLETRILLTQQKATQYAGALCAELASMDSDAERSAALRTMADKWDALERTIRRWLTVVEVPPTGGASGS